MEDLSRYHCDVGNQTLEWTTWDKMVWCNMVHFGVVLHGMVSSWNTVVMCNRKSKLNYMISYGMVLSLVCYHMVQDGMV